MNSPDFTSPEFRALLDLVEVGGLAFYPRPGPHFRRADLSGVFGDDSLRMNQLVRAGVVARDAESGRVWLTSAAGRRGSAS